MMFGVRKSVRALDKVQAAVMEACEERRMLSAAHSTTVEVAGGVLTVNGTRRQDDIYVAFSTEDAAKLEVTNHGVRVGELIDPAGLTVIKIFGGQGVDRLGVLNTLTLPAELWGGEAKDILNGGAGADSLYGDNGKDALTGGAGADSLTGGRANDTIFGLEDADVLSGGKGHDVIVGGEGDDTMSGGENNDTLDGGDGNDVVEGGSGDDSLDGGTGTDDVTGEDGADVFDDGDDASELKDEGDDDSILA